MNSVHKWALCAMILCIGYTTFLFVAMLASWIGGMYLGFYDPLCGMLQRITDMPMAHRILGLCVDSVSFGILCASIFLCIKLMNLCRQKLYFSPETLICLSRLSRWALAWACYNPIRYMLLSVITSLHFPVGQRELALTITSSDLINILIIGCIAVVTAFIREGYVLQQERDLTI